MEICESPVEGPPLARKFSIESSSDEECDFMLQDSECAEVLLIDDQLFNLFAMQGQLGEFGVPSESSTSGEKALELLKQRLASAVGDENYS